MADTDWYRVDPGDLEVGRLTTVVAAGRALCITRTEDGYGALDNRCPHQGGRLCDGLITGLAVGDRAGEFRMIRKGEMVRCPWHGWEFDIRTGQSWCDPTRLRVRRYEVTVEEAAPAPGMVKGPYLVETYPVSVEGEYLVVEVR